MDRRKQKRCHNSRIPQILKTSQQNVWDYGVLIVIFFFYRNPNNVWEVLCNKRHFIKYVFTFPIQECSKLVNKEEQLVIQERNLKYLFPFEGTIRWPLKKCAVISVRKNPQAEHPLISIHGWAHMILWMKPAVAIFVPSLFPDCPIRELLYIHTSSHTNGGHAPLITVNGPPSWFHHQLQLHFEFHITMQVVIAPLPRCIEFSGNTSPVTPAPVRLIFKVSR